VEIKELSKDLINRANGVSFGGKRGTNSEIEYKSFVEKILSWDISEEKKQKLLDKLYDKRSELLKHEAQHVSVMVAGPAKYNARKLDHSDKIISLLGEFYRWFDGLEKQIKQGAQNLRCTIMQNLLNFTRYYIQRTNGVKIATL